MSLFATLNSVSETMRAFERGLGVVQNNVANASTPGYARQTQALMARPFDLQSGLRGGVESGLLVSSRNRFAERNVWHEQHLANGYAQRKANLESVEPVLTIRENAGVPSALNGLFEAFSQLTVAPNSAVLRQNAIERARTLSQRFNEAAIGLTTAAASANGELTTSVQRINALGARIAEINVSRRASFEARAEPGSDATLHATLEELAEVADFTVLEQADGTVSVYLDGQSALVIGERNYNFSLDLSGTSAIIRDSGLQDVTGVFQSGQLGSLLDFRNSVLPSYQTDLDNLAIGVADQINSQLAAGLDQNNATPTLDLFSYNATAGAAATLSVTNITPTQLAMATSAAPGGNGNALNLAALAHAPILGGKTFTNFYSDLAARLGRDLESAEQSADTHQLLLTQARTLRNDLSGVSLDEEATKLIQFQRSYEAAAQLFKVVDEMTQTLLSIVN